jgi:acyl-CoA thioesterase FadM
MTVETPFARYRATVKPAWVDHNGHMGIRSYTHVFDRAIWAFYGHLGLTREAMAAENRTIFALQEASWYRREVMLGDPLVVVSQLIDIDRNKLVTFHRLRQTRDGYDAAMTELIEISIDNRTRRPAAFSAAVAERLKVVMDAHRHLERPKESGQGIGIKRR